MLERMACGELPPKHHVALKGAGGALRYEACLTRDGFSGPYSISYHMHPPHTLQRSAEPTEEHGPVAEEARAASVLRRRHFRTEELASSTQTYAMGTQLLYNDDLSLSLAKPSRSDTHYRINADADQLLFVRRGHGNLRTTLGDVAFSALDYVFIPKGLLHRFEFGAGETQYEFLIIECFKGLSVPAQFRNEVGQLRMDAPYCHRDFRRPVFLGPIDEGLRKVVIQRKQQHHVFSAQQSPLDVVGWDGAVYPWAFPILAFQPRVGLVHLPPTVHGTFAAGGALICSFVPRPLDFHPHAIPCPYPHTSVDVDEVLYYVSDEFTSRAGIGAGSLTLHPRGIPHGPQHGKYEASLGATHTQELAVMLDCTTPLRVTASLATAEDTHYELSFLSQS